VKWSLSCSKNQGQDITPVFSKQSAANIEVICCKIFTCQLQELLLCVHITVYNCRTQYGTFLTIFPLILWTIIIVQMLSNSNKQYICNSHYYYIEQQDKVLNSPETCLVITGYQSRPLHTHHRLTSSHFSQMQRIFTKQHTIMWT